MSRWIIYQIFLVIILFACLTIIDLNFTVNQIVNDYNSAYLMLLFHFWILFFIYLIFLFEAKKSKNVFMYPIWRKMPFIILTLSLLSLGFFMYMAMNDSLLNLMAQSAWFVFSLFIYFYLLVFVFIFSLEFRKVKAKRNIEKTVHLTFLLSTLLLVGAFIFF